MKAINFLIAFLISSSISYGQTSASFNSGPDKPLQNLLASLESNCWEFNGFTLNTDQKLIPIEGNGSLASVPGSKQNVFYTPVLDIRGELDLSFSYRLSSATAGVHTLEISLTDSDNQQQLQLEKMLLSGSDTTIVRKTFGFRSVSTGKFRLKFSFISTGSTAGILIDELLASANPVYASGCNSAPVAKADTITGKANRIASGNLLINAYDPDQESIHPYIFTPSPDGTISLQPDGNFIFSPKPGFSGDETRFTYQVCDDGAAALCSESAEVLLKYPSASMIPVSLIDFNGYYKHNGRVHLSWITNFESNSARFDIERSVDGMEWIKAGSVINSGTSGNQNRYSFEDDAGKRLALKKDLYYRLKQIDQNGTVAVSRLLLVRVYNTPAVKMVSVTPNPAVNDIGVTLTLNDAAVVSMKVRDAGGREVNRLIVKAPAGTQQYHLKGTSSLSPGLYLLEVIINSKERMTVKLIKE